MFNFEKLETWHKAIDFARFLEIATGSLFEVSQSFLSKRQGFLSKGDFDRIYAVAEEQGKMLRGLRRSVLDGA
jgi:four helix bundle protein